MAAQNLESAPSTEQTLRDKYSISDLPEGQEPKGGELAPASDPDEPPQEPKPLTDEEKAERKRRNDERRERRWYEERGEMRARMRQMEQEVEELRKTADKRDSAPAARSELSFKALLDTHLKSGKHTTYEDALAAAQEEYHDARESRLTEKIERESSTRVAVRQVEEARNAFEKDAREFSKAHDDFDDVHAEVAAALDSRDAKGNPVGNAVTRALLTSKNPSQLIYHIGTHPELLDELQGLIADDEEAAAVRLGEIRASLRKEQAPVEKKEPSAGRGRSSPRITGRGSTGMTRDERLQAAATSGSDGVNKSGDFLAFQKANRAKS